MQTSKVLNHPGFVRDLNTQAILNTDHISVKKHEKRLEDLQSEEARKRDIQDMKNDIKEIKALLRQFSNCSINLNK